MFKPFAPKLVHEYFKAGRARLKRFVHRLEVLGCSSTRQDRVSNALTCAFVAVAEVVQRPRTGWFTDLAGLFTEAGSVQRFGRVGRGGRDREAIHPRVEP
ncbi:hypothetical protein GCM10027456_02450 [Kineosporia babensis]